MEPGRITDMLIRLEKAFERMETMLNEMDKRHEKYEETIGGTIEDHDKRIRKLEDDTLRQQMYSKAIITMLSGILALLSYGLKLWESFEKLFAR